MTYVYNSQLDAFALYHKTQEDSEYSSSTTGGPALPALGHAVAGSIGSAISNLAVFPLDLVITRLQVQRQLRKEVSAPDEAEYTSVQDAFQQIYAREGGILAFYTGVIQDTGKSVLDAFLFFLFYNFLRQKKLRSRGSGAKALPVLEELNVGMLAGAMSKLLTTPLANIVTRKQTSALIASRSMNSSKPVQPSVRDIIKQIRAEKGVAGFWSGYSASLVLTLNPSLTFFLFEFFKRVTLPKSYRDNPGARVTFFLAAISKAIASTVTYPFSLAKARSQVAARSSNGHEKVEGNATEKSEDATSSASPRPPAPPSPPKTVFSAIIQIAQRDGAGALYEGLLGEVIKGFFSHGITMIVKEAVHKLIIQAYFLILKATRRYPSPHQLAQEATVHAQSVLDSSTTAARNASQSIKAQGASVASNGRKAVQNGISVGKAETTEALKTAKNAAAETVQSVVTLASKPIAAANEMVDITSDYVGDFADEISEAFRGLGDDDGH
ncbi:MAG: hypothetical protein M1825_004310 [Sarcosagium campestre]|nr:MAG: hypothetical protein M1825_004310 [Sarcosagium campestre]